MPPFESGDKVRINSVPHRGGRGVVVSVSDKAVVIQPGDARAAIKIKLSEVTNFSAAARKAWLSMPERRVGRPKGSVSCDRISVTLRIDRELWEEFRRKETSGLISDRTEAINRWFRANLSRLRGKGAKG